MPNQIMRYFDHRHLVEGPLRDVSKGYTEMAEKLDKFLPNGPEKSEALRDLLKSKDSAVRAALDLTTEDQRAPQTEDGSIESITKRGDQTVIRRGGGHVEESHGPNYPGPRGHEKTWAPGHGPASVMDVSDRHAGDIDMDRPPQS